MKGNSTAEMESERAPAAARRQTEPELPEVANDPEAAPEGAGAATQQQIQELAYRIYEERGRINGRDVEDWLEAETIIRERGRAA